MSTSCSLAISAAVLDSDKSFVMNKKRGSLLSEDIICATRLGQSPVSNEYRLSSPFHS